jgi:hypothetical protein
MVRATIGLQVFLLMCAPLPQASYIAVGVGREAGLAMALLLALYAASDTIVITAIALGVRRLPLPRRVRALVERTATRAERATRGRATLPALFATGFASLYTAGVLAGLRRGRLWPALTAAVIGDLVQFTGTVALGGALARLLPFPGADWVFILVAPLLIAALPAAAWTARAVFRLMTPAIPGRAGAAS